MPESKNHNPRTTRKKTTNNEPQQKLLCHIHDKIDLLDKVDEIRINVCVPESEYPLTEFEGKYYCLFHLPTKDKDIEKFEKIFQDRLEKTDKQCAEIEAEFPDDEELQRSSKWTRKIFYNFRYVWFPSKVNLEGKKFIARASFKAVTFTSDADFMAAKFMSGADFDSAIFDSSAHFDLAEFKYGAGFGSAIFSSNAGFSSTKFSRDAYFNLAKFSKDVDFSFAKFDESSEIFFREVVFEGKLNLKNAVIKGYAGFEGKRNNRLFVRKESLLDLQNTKIDDAKKISFHTVRLEPSWFINTDATEFIFTDCEWYYTDGKRLTVRKELQNLKDRKNYGGKELFENPNALLTKACWQLADNHEESKSFGKSSMFRRIAQESKRLETPWYFQPFTLHWWYYAFSFYGERWWRAFFMLIGILFVCGVFYDLPFAYFELPEKKKSQETASVQIEETKSKLPEYHKMNNLEGIIYSINVAALQRPEPKPASDSDLTKAVVILETIFAPLQAALLALAIRRKFMR